MWFTTLLTLTHLLHLTSAHGGALNYTVGETWYPGYDPYADAPTQDSAPNIVQRKWASNNPIFSPTNSSLTCNYPGTAAPASIPLRAGANITAVYGPWVHTVGPMVAWMAYCSNADNDCATFPLASALWFKIGERGLLEGSIQTGLWFQGAFSRWDGQPSLWEETVPLSLKKGRYLVRHEIVSLHSAGRPQFYPECVHVEVSREGVEGDGELPGEEYLVGIPGVWSMDQPEINIDIYSPEVANKTVYKIPGPPVWKG